MTTAFVLSGGGNMGAVQVGMLAALQERRIVPDLLVGTSVGALNVAYLGDREMTADAIDGLAGLWRRVRRRDAFPVDPLRQMLALTGRRPSLCSSEPLRRLIADNVGYRRLEDANVPVHLVTTNVLTGEKVCLYTGDTVSAVLASTALPAVFPAVEIDGMVLCDGGMAVTGGVSRAVALGADQVYLLPAGHACALTEAPAGPMGAAVHALSLLIQRQLLLEIAHTVDQAELHVLPPLCPVSVSPLDFTRAGELIGRAYQATSTWLADGSDRLPNPERFLSLHGHGPGHNVAAAQREEIRHGAYPPGPARTRRASAG
ncbi:MAG: patatin-like phospholipase family protein [Pseudonocardiaceae bacterium]